MGSDDRAADPGARRAYHPGELPLDKLRAIMDARMGPEHGHLNSLMPGERDETEHLLSSPANAASLQASVAQAKGRRGFFGRVWDRFWCLFTEPTAWEQDHRDWREAEKLLARLEEQRAQLEREHVKQAIGCGPYEPGLVGAAEGFAVFACGSASRLVREACIRSPDVDCQCRVEAYQWLEKQKLRTGATRAGFSGEGQADG